eukprot:GHVS01030293.1.p1 GENE.GHVS01030293.1~~GHVS01030293.1.p1  ORF type:complete len:175 (+),score=8.30 GHVS01030293.1:513-1037(+)
MSSGFRRLMCEHCVFVKMVSTVFFLIVLFWVDDILIAGSTQKLVDGFKVEISSQYEIDKGELTWFLGMDIKRKKGKLVVTQKKYVEQLLQNFGMTQCKPVATPAEVGVQLVSSTETASMEMHAEYITLIGGLLYLSCTSRPDISFIVGKLSSYVTNPSNQHYQAASVEIPIGNS